LRYLVAVILWLALTAWVPMDGPVTVTRPRFEAWMGQWVTSHLTAARCWRYVSLVDRWNPDFDLPREVVLAVMAKESACYPNMDDGLSIGLMAVTPRPWLFSEEELRRPDLNIYAGMYILASALRKGDGDLPLALAAYNCGWESLKEGKCIDGGGHDYAASVLGYWLPIIEEGK
jgi:soluble lytic murein transglycosylase-like protein